VYSFNEINLTFNSCDRRDKRIDITLLENNNDDKKAKSPLNLSTFSQDFQPVTNKNSILTFTSSNPLSPGCFDGYCFNQGVCQSYNSDPYVICS
jgi:hypothetical protein